MIAQLLLLTISGLAPLDTLIKAAPILDAYQGEILIALFTVFWGIIVETWFVSRWTIIFNVVPFIVMLMTLDLGGWVGFLGLYLLVSILLSLVTGHQGLKQAVGAKGYGALSLALGLVGAESNAMVYLTWFALCIPVYGAWYAVRHYKMEYYSEW